MPLCYNPGMANEPITPQEEQLPPAPQERSNAGARTKLNAEMIKKAKVYYEEEATDKPVKDAGGNIIGYDINLPTKEGLALWLNVSRKTVYNWADDSEEAIEGLTEEEIDLKRQFLHIFDQIMSEQGRRLINKGLAGKYNPLIGKLLLGRHGYKDEMDLTSGEQPIKSVQFEIVSARKAQTEAAHEAEAARNASPAKEPGGATE